MLVRHSLQSVMEHNYNPLWNGPKEDTLLWKTCAFPRWNGPKDDTLLWKTHAFPLWNGPKDDAFLEREREGEEEREWVYGLCHHF